MVYKITSDKEYNKTYIRIIEVIKLELLFLYNGICNTGSINLKRIKSNPLKTNER